MTVEPLPPAFAGPLAGITVIESGTGVAVAFCGKLLADFGANVIKLEHPRTEDPLRAMPPFTGTGAAGRSALHLFLNANKRSVTIDTTNPVGASLFQRLVGSADIFTTFAQSHDLAATERLLEVARAGNRDLIDVTLSWLGMTGPWRSFACDDFLAQHLGGMAFSTAVRIDDPATQPPLASPGHLAEMAAGLTAATAAMVGLFGREACGEGDQIEVAIVETIASFLRQEVVTYSYGAGLMSRKRAAVSQFAGVFQQPTGDGWVDIMIRTEAGWRALIEIVGNPEWADSEAFATHPQRSLYWDAVEPLLQAELQRYPSDHLHREGQGRGIAISSMNTVEAAARSDQFAERGFFRTVQHPAAGELRIPGPPFSLGDDSPSIPAPDLGRDTVAVFAELLGCSAAEVAQLVESGVV